MTKIFQKSQMPRGLPRGREWAVLELTGTLVDIVSGLDETRGAVCADMPGLDGSTSFVPFPSSNTSIHLSTDRGTSPSLSVQ